jgi:hypothetical protein
MVETGEGRHLAFFVFAIGALALTSLMLGFHELGAVDTAQTTGWMVVFVGLLCLIHFEPVYKRVGHRVGWFAGPGGADG